MFTDILHIVGQLVEIVEYLFYFFKFVGNANKL